MRETPRTAISLNNRAVIAVSGVDARTFLQGLITNDIERVGPKSAIYTGLLSPQGKYLFDFFIVEDSGRLLFDCEAERRAELIRTLNLYKLRAEVEIEDISGDMEVWAIIGQGESGLDGGIIFADPRQPGLGSRALLPANVEPPQPHGTPDDYDELRLSLGVPDGSRDIEVGRQTFLEANAKELAGVDFEKGCYVGQEVTARMNYRGTLKKRLLPISFEGPPPPPGSLISAADKRAGDVRSGTDGRAMALFRLEFLDAALELEDGRACAVEVPDWLALDGASESPPS